MKRFLRRLFVVLWAAIGCMGVGIAIGWWWLDRVLDRDQGTTPTVRVVEVVEGGLHDACIRPPETMDQFYRAFQNERGSDLVSFVARATCGAATDASRLAFVAMLGQARRTGDAIAARALEVMTMSSCAALTEVTGTTAKLRDATTRACIDIAMGSASSADPVADVVRAETFQFAARLAIVAAGVADVAIRTAFCSDVERLAQDVYQRVLVVRPDLPTLIERACAEPFGNSGVGGNE